MRWSSSCPVANVIGEIVMPASLQLTDGGISDPTRRHGMLPIVMLSDEKIDALPIQVEPCGASDITLPPCRLRHRQAELGQIVRQRDGARRFLHRLPENLHERRADP